MTQGFDGGTLVCSANCMSFNTTNCTVCGDGLQEGPEECDGMDLDGLVCSDVDMGTVGLLSCHADCTLDSSQCCLPAGAACMSDSDCCSGNCSGMFTCQ